MNVLQLLCLYLCVCVCVCVCVCETTKIYITQHSKLNYYTQACRDMKKQFELEILKVKIEMGKRGENEIRLDDLWKEKE